MDREYLLTALSLLAALLPPLSGLVSGEPPVPSPSAREAERRAWRHLWLPFVPTAIWFAFLLGWVLREPDNAEGLPVDARVLTAVAALIALRAVSRAWQTAQVRAMPLVGVVGLFRPRVHVSAPVTEALAPEARAAALAHEEAHVRHRDPLRLWLATLATDLQLGLPAATRRLRAWRHALELARDEEAREQGADGADLASAILRVTRMEHGFDVPNAALLEGDAAVLRDRVNRLLAPIPANAPTASNSAWLLPLLFVAVFAGALGGEALVGWALN